MGFDQPSAELQPQRMADIEMDDFETRATRQRMNALMGEIHGDSDED